MGTQKQRHIRHKMCLKLQTVADLSRHLDVPVAYLHTLARELDERCEDSSLYKTWERPKKTSGVRCIDAPREKLKWVQKRINERILQRLRVHQTVKGGVRGADLVRHVQSHVGKPMVANFDLENFFSNIRSGRVYDLFSRLGCSPDVSRLLTRLTTFKGRIPQGAPTSTMLANLVVGYTGGPSFSNRLQTLAAQHGGESSIWVDDLTISGPPYLPRLAPTVDRIARQCSFTLNPHKNFFQSQGKRQIVTGLIVNEKPNIPREEYRRIRALLHKCRRLGPRAVVEQSSSMQSVLKLRAHLRGKVAYVQRVNTAQGAKLLEQFNAIDWSE